MSEGADKESKTLEATEKRVQDALEKGNVPVSREMAGFASLLAILSIVVIIPAAGFGRLSPSWRPHLNWRPIRRSTTAPMP